MDGEFLGKHRFASAHLPFRSRNLSKLTPSPFLRVLRSGDDAVEPARQFRQIPLQRCALLIASRLVRPGGGRLPRGEIYRARASKMHFRRGRDGRRGQVRGRIPEARYVPLITTIH